MIKYCGYLKACPHRRLRQSRTVRQSRIRLCRMRLCRMRHPHSRLRQSRMRQSCKPHATKSRGCSHGSKRLCRQPCGKAACRMLQSRSVPLCSKAANSCVDKALHYIATNAEYSSFLMPNVLMKLLWSYLYIQVYARVRVVSVSCFLFPESVTTTCHTTAAPSETPLGKPSSWPYDISV